MAMNCDDVIEKIKERVDPEELIDRLGLDTEELCDLLYDEIKKKINLFNDLVEEDGDEFLDWGDE